MIELRNVTKSYGATHAVRDLSFKVEQGEILGFLGPNGAGKTTTMKMLTCYMPPSEGEILVQDMSVEENSMEIRRMIGYLPESTPLYEDMGVLEYLGFIADIRRIDSAQQRGAIDRVVADTGLSDVVYKDIGELSKGYRQRVGLAQAMVHDPDILVLDEPTSGLDPNQIVEIRNLIKTLGEKKTVIFSTHIMQEVQATTDRVLIINNGQIAAQGTAEELQAGVEGQQLVHAVFKGAKEGELRQGLGKIEGVSLKRVAGSGDELEVELSCPLGTQAREAVFRCAVERGWVLLELTPSRLSLEDVFRQLTN